MAMQQPTAAAQVPLMPVDVKQPAQVAAGPGQVPVPPLPAGWFEMKDPSGKTMYFNSANGTTTWQRPMVRQLPPGWIKAQTPDGKTIFVHTATQQCSFQFPMALGTPVIPSAPVAAANAKPQLTRITSTPTQPAPTAPAPANPNLRRATTMPVNASVPANVRDPSLVTMTMNTTVARKSIPGFNEAHAIHQISTRNNSQVLGKKLGADVAHAGVALKDTTITAASLATRQAKAVGQTMVSKTKMQKASKKAIVHTGALGVKIGRASKSLMHEMVDAADGKGKYKPKVRSFVPQDPLPTTAAAGQKQKAAQVHAYEYEQAASQSGQQVQQAAVQPRPINSGVPARKPVKRPSVSLEFTQNTVLQAAEPAKLRPPADQTEQSTGQYIETAEGVAAPSQTQPTTAAEKPPRPMMDVNTSIDISAQANVDINLTGSSNKPPAQMAQVTTQSASPHPQHLVQQHSAQPLKPTQQVQLQQQPNTPSASFSIQADVNASASFTYQSQSSSNAPPPPYSPQTQPVSAAPTPQIIRPRPQQRPHSMASPAAAQQQTHPVQQQQQYIMVDPATQQPQYIIMEPTPQQQPQQIVIQQQQQDSGADAYLQASNMMALQQQVQSMQMQQQFQQIQSVQQQQVVDQSLYQQQVVDQPVYQQSMVQPQDTAQEVYFVEDTSNIQTTAGGDVYAQQEQQFAYVDANGTAMYAQETTTEVYAADGSAAVYTEETVVYEEQDYVAGEGGEVVYAEEVDVYEVEGGEEAGLGEMGGIEEVECEEAEAECDFECDF